MGIIFEITITNNEEIIQPGEIVIQQWGINNNGTFADNLFKVSTYTFDGGNLIDESAVTGKLSCNSGYNYINEEMIQLADF